MQRRRVVGVCVAGVVLGSLALGLNFALASPPTEPTPGAAPTPTEASSPADGGDVGAVLLEADLKFPGVYVGVQMRGEGFEVRYSSINPAADAFIDFVIRKTSPATAIQWLGVPYTNDDWLSLGNLVNDDLRDAGLTVSGGSFDAEAYEYVAFVREYTEPVALGDYHLAGQKVRIRIVEAPSDTLE